MAGRVEFTVGEVHSGNLRPESPSQRPELPQPIAQLAQLLPAGLSGEWSQYQLERSDDALPTTCFDILLFPTDPQLPPARFPATRIQRQLNAMMGKVRSALTPEVLDSFRLSLAKFVDPRQ